MFYDSLSGKYFVLPSDRSTSLPIYVCGLTVYDYAHLGHARMFITFDTFRRGLMEQGYQPLFIQNITDIDDKILNKMVRLGLSLDGVTEPFIEAMHEDRVVLNILPPDREPRATDHIDDMIDLIQRLLDKNHAYVSADGIQYRAPGNDDVSTHFALWKFQKDGELVAYESPWGKGRPGWHIECSAMIHHIVGDVPLWMHGGGHDLHFPHHHNERLQSEVAYGHPLAEHWMHNAFVRVNQEKMSKSLDNFFTIREVLKEVSAGTLRYYISKTHYRDNLEYADVTLKNAQHEWHALINTLMDVQPDVSWNDDNHASLFFDAFNDDMNTTRMWHHIHQWVQEGSLHSAWNGLRVLGLDALIERERIIPADIVSLAEERWKARTHKDYATSDLLRQKIHAHGYDMLDGKDGYRVIVKV